jgi:hypothetical protein
MTAQGNTQTKTVYEASTLQAVWLHRQSANSSVPEQILSQKDSYCTDRATD